MSTNDPQLCTARLAVFVLGAVTSSRRDTLPPSAIELEYDGEILHGDAVVARLASLPKPLECRSEIAGEALILSCQPLSPENRWIHDAFKERGASEVQPFREQVGRRAEDKILVQNGRGESQVVARKCLDAFERDYVVLGTYVRTGRKPTSEQQEGIVEVVTYAESKMRTLRL